MICTHYGVVVELWGAADWCALDSIVPAVSGLRPTRLLSPGLHGAQRAMPWAVWRYACILSRRHCVLDVYNLLCVQEPGVWLLWPCGLQDRTREALCCADP